MGKTKIKTLLISALILGFVFGYDDKQPFFELSYWFLNFLKLSVISFISLFVFSLTPNLFAGKYGCRTHYELWDSKKKKIKIMTSPSKRRKIKIPYIPVGIVLPLLITLFSKGLIYFSTTMQFIVEINPAYRIGKKFSNMTNYENAKLALISPLTAIIIAVISKLIFPQFPEITLINSMIAISYILPLPKTNGAQIYFNSKILYILSLVFILLTAILLNFINPLRAAIIAIICALIVTGTYIIKIFKN